jgi:hypothetical protein
LIDAAVLFYFSKYSKKFSTLALILRRIKKLKGGGIKIMQF